MSSEAAKKPTPLNPFVNREKETESIPPKLKAIQKGEWLFDFVLTVTGIPGIGKTTFLRRIEQLAQDDGIKTILFTYDATSDKLSPFQNIAKSLSFPTPLTDYDEDDKLDSFVREFAKNLRSELSEKPLVFLIDDTHYMDASGQEIWEGILERVYVKNRLLIVLAGRRNLRFKSFELRRRMRPIALECFKEEHTNELVTEPKHSDLSNKIFQLTHGYPLASVHAYEWVFRHKLKPADPEIGHQLEARETELIFELVSTILSDHIFIHLQDKTPRNFLEYLLKSLSPLRRFDDILLHELLKKVGKEHYDTVVDMLTIRGHIRQLAASTYMVKWESGRMGYALDFSIRRLLSLEMKFRDQAFFLKIHQFMADWYQDAIDKAAERDPGAPQTVMYLIEHIFHFSQLCQTKGQTEHMETDICEKIGRRFKDYYFREKNHFYEEFKKDEELAESLEDSFDSLKSFIAEQLKA